jgi:hypothetical protein
LYNAEAKGWDRRRQQQGPNRGKQRMGRVVWLPRKRIVKVVLSEEQKEILDGLARRLGISESETLRMALMDYAKELSLMKESIHRGKNQI